jgi:hypothetical protein
MKNVFIIILTIILIAPLPFACNRGEVGKYKIKSLAIQSGKYSIEHLPNYSQINFNASTNDTIPKNQFALKLSITNVEYTSNHSPVKGSLVSSAQAYDEPPIPLSKISLISIYSQLPVYANNKIYEPLDNLTDLFTASFEFFYNNEDSQPILKFIDNMNFWENGYDIILLFKSTLDQPLAQKLKVIVTMDDGTVFELETEKVVVK